MPKHDFRLWQLIAGLHILNLFKSITNFHGRLTFPSYCGQGIFGPCPDSLARRVQGRSSRVVPLAGTRCRRPERTYHFGFWSGRTERSTIRRIGYPLPNLWQNPMCLEKQKELHIILFASLMYWSFLFQVQIYYVTTIYRVILISLTNWKHKQLIEYHKQNIIYAQFNVMGIIETLIRYYFIATIR